MLSNPSVPSAANVVANQEMNALGKTTPATHSLTPEEWKQLAQVAAVMMHQMTQRPTMNMPQSQPLPEPNPIPLLQVPNMGGS